MIFEKFELWEGNKNVTLSAYLLDNSQEFHKNKKRPAIIVCPGGGYLGSSDREAEPIAMRFSAQGYHTFVLRYSTYFTEMISDIKNTPEPNESSVYPQPLFDLAKAILTVRENADKWFIDSDKIAVCGFSAGGHLTASIGVHWHEEFLKEKLGVSSELLKPNAIILGYPVLDYDIMKKGAEASNNEWITDFWQLSNRAVFGKPYPSEEEIKFLSPTNYVSTKTPPTFMWHTANDGLVYVENSLKFATELTKNHIPYDLHIFESGVHGLSLCDETTASEEAHINPHCAVWFDIAVSWLKKHFA